MTVERGHRGIVIGIDGSAGSRSALLWALAECHLRARPLLVVHIFGASRTVSGPAGAGVERAALIESGERLLAESAALAAGQHPAVTATTLLSHGDPAEVLVQLGTDAELLVIGIGGASGDSSGLLGSVTHRVALGATCPVAVIPEQPLTADAIGSAQVVAGVASAPAGRLAFAFAFDEARYRHASLICVRAWGRSELRTDGHELTVAVPSQPADELLLSDLSAVRHRYPDVRVEQRLVPGGPADALLEAAETAQLMILGCVHGDEDGRARLGPVSMALLSRATCPVILIGQQVGVRHQSGSALGLSSVG